MTTHPTDKTEQDDARMKALEDIKKAIKNLRETEREINTKGWDKWQAMHLFNNICALRLCVEAMEKPSLKIDEESVRKKNTAYQIANAIQSWIKPDAVSVPVDTDHLEMWVDNLRDIPELEGDIRSAFEYGFKCAQQNPIVGGDVKEALEQAIKFAKETRKGDIVTVSALLDQWIEKWERALTHAPALDAVKVPEGYKLVPDKAIELLRRTKGWLADAGVIEAAIRRMGMVLDMIESPAPATTAPNDSISDNDILEYIENECADVRCVSDGDDGYTWQVFSHWMAEPQERLCGIGQTVKQAVISAMKNEIIDKQGNCVPAAPSDKRGG